MKYIATTDPIFTDENKAIEYLEQQRWNGDPVCPHCGGMDRTHRITGKSARKGLLFCGHCRKQFTVTIGTIMESSHVSINKWLLAFHLMCSSKKGISAHQLHRMLGVTYKTAWFMNHRIREVFDQSNNNDKLGGEGKTVEADETFWGSKNQLKGAKGGWMHKEKIFSVLERNGEVRSFRVDRVDGKTLKPILKAQVHENTAIMTDDMGAYSKIGQHFDSHDVIRHSRGEYVRAGNIHTNTIEGFFSILKRGLTGVYQHVMSHHLQRYVKEFDFRYTYRKVNDTERFNIALSLIEGKRLYYRLPSFV